MFYFSKVCQQKMVADKENLKLDLKEIFKLNRIFKKVNCTVKFQILTLN